MKNQNKTRFEVGMPVIAIIDGETKITKVTSVTDTTEGHGSYPIRIEWECENFPYKSVFTKDGFQDLFCEIPSLFTLPEYEALKALTDSFVDGTFGKEQVNTETKEGEVGYRIADSQGIAFRPTIDEMVVYDDKELNIESMYRRASVICVLSNRTHTAIGNLSPVIGYQYANGFCIPLLKEEQTDPEQSAQPTTETTDLLENGQPVYFEVGQEVGCLLCGKGKIKDKNKHGELFINFYEKDGCYTFDGKKLSGINQTLYPIEQYNTIQLPKLKPIQVAKPKEDVIELPSWFKDVIYLDTDNVIAYLIGFLISKEKEFNRCLDKANISLKNCKFMSCVVQNIGDCKNALCVDFVHGNKVYSLTIDAEQPENIDAAFTVQYNKNGKDIREML